MRFERHIFICTNERPPPSTRPSCGEEQGLELVKAFKKALVERGLKGRLRAQKSGCLDACDYGPTVVVYPEGTYYGQVKLQDVEEIVEEHLVHGRPVTRLLDDFTKPSQNSCISFSISLLPVAFSKLSAMVTKV